MQDFPAQDIPKTFNLYYLEKEGGLSSITNNDQLQAKITQFMQDYGASKKSMKLILAKDATEAKNNVTSRKQEKNLKDIDRMMTCFKEGEDITKNIPERQQTNLNPNFVLQSKVNAFNFEVMC
jgi:hypothetical protein